MKWIAVVAVLTALFAVIGAIGNAERARNRQPAHQQPSYNFCREMQKQHPAYNYHCP
jgi:hypothetical protein